MNAAVLRGYEVAAAIPEVLMRFALDRPNACGLTWVKDLELVQDKEVDGCFHLVGTKDLRADVELWIDEEDLLIRRIGRKEFFAELDWLDEESPSLLSYPFSTVCEFTSIQTTA